MKKLIITLMSFFICTSLFSMKIVGDKIVDERGNSIEKKEFKKIIVLDPAVVESFYLIGAEKNIVAIADTTRIPIWPVEKTKLLPKAGTLTKPSLEHVLSFSPDLVILNSMSEGFAESLKSRKLNFIVNEGKSFEQILENLDSYGVITGNREQALKVKEEYINKLSTIKKTTAEKLLNIKGAFLFSTSPMMVFTEKSLPGQIFETLGIENIANNLPGGRPIISAEYLIAQNPDILVGSMAIKNKDDILNSNPFVKETKAGKNKNIFILDSNKILRGTPRIIDALLDLHMELSNGK